MISNDYYHFHSSYSISPSIINPIIIITIIITSVWAVVHLFLLKATKITVLLFRSLTLIIPLTRDGQSKPYWSTAHKVTSLPVSALAALKVGMVNP